MNQPDDSLGPWSPSSSDTVHRKRSTRACDECRKTKSKCTREEGENSPCTACRLSGVECTFLGPSYKRGPPKGYIQAVELRLRQVESILATIIASSDSRAQTLIQNIKLDPLASTIINRVDQGPFGPSARASQTSPSLSQEALWDAVTQPPSPVSAARSARSLRESRLDRESISLDQEPLEVPTLEWQSNILSLINQHSSTGLRNPSSSMAGQFPFPVQQFPPGVIPPQAHPSQATSAGRGDPGISIPSHSAQVQSIPSGSGLPFSVSDIPEQLQRMLVETYFIQVHPFLPLLHKEIFLEQFRNRQPGQAAGWDFLLISIFAISSRYANTRQSSQLMQSIDEAQIIYYAEAIKTCKELIHVPSVETCQAILILSYGELGLSLGPFSQGHSHSLAGIAIRMAQDLNLHRTSHQRHEDISSIQNQARQRIWWTCVLMDAHLSAHLFRIPMIRKQMFDVEIITEDQEEISHFIFSQSSELHQGYVRTIDCRPILYLNAISSLSLILGRILSKIYALDALAASRSRKNLPMLIEELQQWFRTLPPPMRFNEANSNAASPDVLVLHMQYCLWMNCASLPSVQTEASSPQNDISANALRYSELAATHVSNLATLYWRTYSLKTCPPFLFPWLRNAGIMHRNSCLSPTSNPQARQLLTNTIAALKEIESIWPSAGEAWKYLADNVPIPQITWNPELDISYPNPNIPQSSRPYNPPQQGQKWWPGPPQPGPSRQ